MKKPNLTRLEHDERLRGFRYHIRGIVEATENVIDLVANRNSAYERDADAFAMTTSRLEVEALHHLGYHVKSLRTPLRRLQREAYERLEENGKSASKRTRKNGAKAKATTPSAVEGGRGTGGDGVVAVRADTACPFVTSRLYSGCGNSSH